jgi:hypothetical protein
VRILDVAVTCLRKANSTTPEAAVAIAALCEAVSQHIALPAGTAATLWATLRTAPESTWASLAASAVGRVSNPELVRDVLLVAMDPASERALRIETLNVLSEHNASQHITDHALVELALVAERIGITQRVVSVIFAAANNRSIPSEVIDRIVERWSVSTDRRARIAAVEVLAVRGWASREIVARLLRDSQRMVRAVTATFITELLATEDARAALAHALQAESSAEVRRIINDELEQLQDEVLF